MKALIIVDVQNDFCKGGTLEAQNGDEVVDVINKISGKFDKVIATQDWHPENHLSFASNNHGTKPMDLIEINRPTYTGYVAEPLYSRNKRS